MAISKYQLEDASGAYLLEDGTGAYILESSTAATATLVDNFDDNSTNTTLWTAFGSVTEASSSLNMATIAAGGTYSGYTSKATYDLTGSSAFIQVVNAGNQTFASLEVFPINIYLDGNNKLFWYINGGSITAFKKDATVQTNLASTTYNSAVHKWFRIRESGGTIFWDYSTDGITWTNFTSSTVSFALTSLLVEPSAGTYAVETGATTAIFDNLSTVPSSTKTLSALGVG